MIVEINFKIKSSMSDIHFSRSDCHCYTASTMLLDQSFIPVEVSGKNLIRFGIELAPRNCMLSNRE